MSKRNARSTNQKQDSVLLTLAVLKSCRCCHSALAQENNWKELPLPQPELSARLVGTSGEVSDLSVHRPHASAKCV